MQYDEQSILSLPTHSLKPKDIITQPRTQTLVSLSGK